LTLAQVGRDDASLAEGHTALSINAPTVVTAGASAAEARPHEKTVAEAARGDLPLNAARAPTPAETSEASSDLARSPSDAPSLSAFLYAWTTLSPRPQANAGLVDTRAVARAGRGDYSW
jgi:hypothetical protein